MDNYCSLPKVDSLSIFFTKILSFLFKNWVPIFCCSSVRILISVFLMVFSEVSVKKTAGLFSKIVSLISKRLSDIYMLLVFRYLLIIIFYFINKFILIFFFNCKLWRKVK